MKLYDLGLMPWQQTQLIYHALGTLDEEALVICSPHNTYACVGLHQDLAYELDLEFCKQNNIGMFRREIGGGTVILDNRQLFYQIILNRKKAPLDQRVLFKKYLEPVIQTYQDLGIDAEYYPVSDLVVNGKKISGNGGGDIGNCKVMTGAILLDFNPELMCRVLNLPSERFRDKVCKAMNERITTVKNELGYIPEGDEIRLKLIENFSRLFGSIERSELTPSITDLMSKLEERFMSEKWMMKQFKRPVHRTVKIMEGINLVFINHRGIELEAELKNEVIRNIQVYGNRSEKLEREIIKSLTGKKYDEKDFVKTLDLFVR